MPGDVGRQLDLGRPHRANKSDGFGRTGRYRQHRDRDEVVASSKALDTLNFQISQVRRGYPMNLSNKLS
jgi:hypothetical protein